jgi:prophage tail gpP-like protein
MVFPKPTELAILTVNGANYQDWETVMVRHALRDHPAYHCKFTCSEGMPIANNFAVLRIRPGDECTVTLAGIPAFKGKVETRQVYMDAYRHHIEIQCATWMEVATASVISKTGEWKDKTFGQIGREILGKMGINLTFEGGAEPSYKFPRVSSMPGESVHDFLDKLIRGMPAGGLGPSFTSNINGDFVTIMGPAGGSDQIIEGQNMKIGREIIFNPSMAGSAPVVAQGPGSDDKWGAAVAAVPFAQESLSTFGKNFTPGVIVSELATSDKKLLQGRGQSEGQWSQQEQITVIATVYGWLRPSGGLWYRDQTVSVTSPSLIMNNEPLIAKSVTFTQDSETGTTTTLELCNPAAIAEQKPGVGGG